MSFVQQDFAFREFSTDQLKSAVKNPAQYSRPQLFILCDELLLRREPIIGPVPKFEALIKSLPGSCLKYIDRFEEMFSKAAVHVVIRELLKRSQSCTTWYALKDGIQQGPYNRMQLEDKISEGQISDADLVWKEGTESWERLDNVERLKEPLFYDQVIEKQPEPPKVTKDTSLSSGNMVASGVLELVKFPFWFIAIFIIPFASFDSNIGILFSTVLGLMLFISIIPVGVGLLLKRKWAWSLKIGTGAIIICWLATRIVLESGSLVWLLFIIPEVIILGLIFSARKVIT